MSSAPLRRRSRDTSSSAPKARGGGRGRDILCSLEEKPRPLVASDRDRQREYLKRLEEQEVTDQSCAGEAAARTLPRDDEQELQPKLDAGKPGCRWPRAEPPICIVCRIPGLFVEAGTQRDHPGPLRAQQRVFLPIVEELLEQPVDPGYPEYLESKLLPLADAKAEAARTRRVGR